FKCCSLARSLVHQEFVNGAVKSQGQRSEYRQTRFSLPVLYCRHLGGGSFDRSGKLFELQAELGASLAYPASKRQCISSFFFRRNGGHRHCLAQGIAATHRGTSSPAVPCGSSLVAVREVHGVHSSMVPDKDSFTKRK